MRFRRRRRRLGLRPHGGRAATRSGRFRHERYRALRRAAVGVAILVVLAAMAGAAGWFYLDYEIDQMARVTVEPGLLTQARPGAPYDVLFVATSGQGKHADLVLVARVAPAEHRVEILEVPAALVVRIPGHVTGVSGERELGDALAGGTSLLLQTVETSLRLPVEHVVDVTPDGFSRMVDAMGGIYLQFSMPVIDQASGLHVGSSGCQQVTGKESVQLTETSTPFYFASGSWRRQVATSPGVPGAIGLALFVALLDRARPSLGNPLGVHDLVRAAAGNVEIDPTWSANALRGAASQLAGVPLRAIGTEALPTRSSDANGAAGALSPAEPAAARVLSAFTAIGAGGPTTGTALTVPVAPWVPRACQP